MSRGDWFAFWSGLLFAVVVGLSIGWQFVGATS